MAKDVNQHAHQIYEALRIHSENLQQCSQTVLRIMQELSEAQRQYLLAKYVYTQTAGRVMRHEQKED